jgi:hypothetical protein
VPHPLYDDASKATPAATHRQTQIPYDVFVSTPSLATTGVNAAAEWPGPPTQQLVQTRLEYTQATTDQK